MSTPTFCAPSSPSTRRPGSPGTLRRCSSSAPQAGNSDGAGGVSSEPEAGAGAGGEVDLELGAGDLTLIVVFDKSGSMGDGWDGRSKWQVANEALQKAIA